MSDTSYDQTGAARQALRDIYGSHGPAGIDNDKLLDQLLPDLLPGGPREASLLRSAASVGVGGLLTDRLSGQMPPEAAVRDVAAILTQRYALDQSASLWVVTEYAGVLGHPVAAPLASDGPTAFNPMSGTVPLGVPGTVPLGVPGTVPLGVPGTMPPLGAPGTVPPPGTAGRDAGPIIGTAPPAGGGRQLPPTAQFPVVPGGDYPPFSPTPPTPGTYLASPPGPYLPGPYQPAYQRPPRGNGPVIAGVAVVVVLLVVGAIVAIVLAAHKPAAKAGPARSPGSTLPAAPTTPVGTPPTSPSVDNTAAPSLDQLLPHDLDVGNDCQTSTDNATGTTGVIGHYDCTEPGTSTLPGAFVFGYQMRDATAFQTSFDALNKFLNFDTTDPGLDSKCPTTSSSGGSSPWDDGGPTIGTVECYDSSQGGYVYVWSDEANRTVLCVAGTKDQTRTQVDSWWTHDSFGHQN